MVAEIVPDDVPDKVPMDTGEAKLPLALDNCAVKTFPDVKVPVIVNGTLIEEPEQYDVGEIVPVVIEGAAITFML